MSPVRRPDPARIRAELKDFQRATVDYVISRMYDPAAPTRRFLVADEVGLGKTLVARGVVAEVVDRLWDTTKRIDIVYICSNQQIARQNLRRLNVLDLPATDLPDRITLLPRALKRLGRQKVNLVAFTPGTSFNLGYRVGRYDERAVLFRMLEDALGRRITSRPATYATLQGAARRGFADALAATTMSDLDARVRRIFARRLGGDAALVAEIDGLTDGRRRRGQDETVLRRRGNVLIGRLRELLARSCIDAIEPDLVILDEFQRFADLLDRTSPASELAHALFDWGDCRTLLLSATPYRMLTLADEPVGDDHHSDLLRTCRFLFNGDAAQVDALAGHLADLRAGLRAGAPARRVRRARDGVQQLLRQVMTRTERLAATPDRAGMLREDRRARLAPTVAEVRAFVAADAVSRTVGGDNVVEYWKAAPYLLNFMDDYQLRRRFDRSLAGRGAELARVLAGTQTLLPRDRVEAYRPIDAQHPKLRDLIADLDAAGAWALLWLPPCLPYFTLDGPYRTPAARQFTKRLVFSAWNVVPRAVAGLLSYEAERRHLRGRRRRWADRANLRKPLEFVVRADTPANMANLALILPSPALAELGDPLVAVAAAGRALPLDRRDLLDAVRHALDARLRPWVALAPEDGPTDNAWYAVAALVLDRDDVAATVSGSFSGVQGDPDDEPQTDLASHLAAAARHAAALRRHECRLGRPPADLADVLAELAVAGPGSSALRALGRVCGGPTAHHDPDVLGAAAMIAWALRSLLNQPEARAIVAASASGQPYWRQVLSHGLDGCLTAVLDEYLHLVCEAEALGRRGLPERARRIATVVADALALRTSVVRADDIQIKGRQISREPANLRLHFALRFGQDHEEAGALQRATVVRTAFNSPFWPFVLVTTSIGQEGLDFHPYCHAVVHWNLPRNPVDLEQREGRVHRYKGHAVRKNVAACYGHRTNLAAEGDPWQQLFDLAVKERPRGESDLNPYWVFPGDARIERIVPLLPLSREIQRLHDLHRTLGAYRLAFGQPRQEDLLALLADRYQPTELAALVAELRIDLTPPTPVRSAASSRRR
jgi:hypothetical protein